MKKRSRFFCESCGAEVAMNAVYCPRCGKSFVSVRCQACGFTGSEELFTQGCPVCGYAMPVSRGSVSAGKDQKVTAGALPPWVYILTLLALTIVGIVLFFTLR